MLKKLFLFCLICTLTFQITGCTKLEKWDALSAITSSEESERYNILYQSESLLLNSKFDELDKIADNYRTTKAEFIDGEWKLNIFYDGMSYYLRKAPEENWLRRIDKLNDWVKYKPDSITARVALAECLVGYAFFKRTWKYADDVKEEQWELFHRYMNEALIVLDQAQKLQNKCPGLWSAYQRLDYSGNWDIDQHYKFLNSAIAFEPKYNTYYFRTAYLLLPWWYGEKGEWEKFAESLANGIGGDEGDIIYTRIIWFMARRSPKNVVDDNPNISWKRVNKGVQLLKKWKK